MIVITIFIFFKTDSPDINIRITGELIDCECDGVPKVYNPYRLDHLSEFGELIHSVNLNNEKFILHHKSYQYQYNGEYRCTVSNGISVVSGQVIQIKSKTVKYEGMNDNIRIEFFLLQF